MRTAFINLANNLGMSFELIIFLIFLFGGLIFFAKDFKIGLMICIVINGVLFMWFFEAGWQWLYPLITMLIQIVLLSFSIYAISNTTTSRAGGII